MSGPQGEHSLGKSVASGLVWAVLAYVGMRFVLVSLLGPALLGDVLLGVLMFLSLVIGYLLGMRTYRTGRIFGGGDDWR